MDLELYRLCGIDPAVAVRTKISSLLAEARRRVDRGEDRAKVEIWLNARLSPDLMRVPEDEVMRATIDVAEGRRE